MTALQILGTPVTQGNPYSRAIMAVGGHDGDPVIGLIALGIIGVTAVGIVRLISNGRR